MCTSLFHCVIGLPAMVSSPDSWAQGVINQAEWYCTSMLAIVSVVVLIITAALGVGAPYMLRKESKEQLRRLADEIGDRLRAETKEAFNEMHLSFKWTAKAEVANANGLRCLGETEILWATWSVSLPGPLQRDHIGRLIGQNVDACYSFISAFQCYTLAGDTPSVERTKVNMMVTITRFSDIRGRLEQAISGTGGTINVRQAEQGSIELIKANMVQLQEKFKQTWQECRASLRAGGVDTQPFDKLADEIDRHFTSENKSKQI